MSNKPQTLFTGIPGGSIPLEGGITPSLSTTTGQITRLPGANTQISQVNTMAPSQTSIYYPYQSDHLSPVMDQFSKFVIKDRDYNASRSQNEQQMIRSFTQSLKNIVQRAETSVQGFLVDPYYNMFAQTQQSVDGRVYEYPSYAYFLGLGQIMLHALENLAKSLIDQCGGGTGEQASSDYYRRINADNPACSKETFDSLLQILEQDGENPDQLYSALIGEATGINSVFSNQKHIVDDLFLKNQRDEELEIRQKLEQSIAETEADLHWYSSAEAIEHSNPELISKITEEIHNSLDFMEQDWSHSQLRLNIMDSLQHEIAPWMMHVFFPNRQSNLSYTTYQNITPPVYSSSLSSQAAQQKRYFY